MITLKSKLENALQAKIIQQVSASGGCTADSFVLTTDQNKKFFCKTKPPAPTMFWQEAAGLKEIAKADCLAVPQVIAVDDAFLLLEYVPRGHATDEAMGIFGQQLARLHRFSHERKYYGFASDNFIGTSRQKNTPQVSLPWHVFYWQYRLLPQWQLAEKKFNLGAKMQAMFAQLENVMDEILPPHLEVPASLLHGDLWSGNFLTSDQGKTYLIDPAVYYGDRETDLALARLFGGFSETFYRAYESEWPLRKGWQGRERIYQLYHLLNHLNMLGESYLGQVKAAIGYYL